MRTDIYSLSNGRIELTWPDAVSPEEIDDVCAWLELVLRGLRRRAANGEEEMKRLRALNESLAERVAAQSDLLTKKAERGSDLEGGTPTPRERA